MHGCVNDMGAPLNNFHKCHFAYSFSGNVIIYGLIVEPIVVRNKAFYIVEVLKLIRTERFDFLPRLPHNLSDELHLTSWLLKLLLGRSAHGDE